MKQPFSTRWLPCLAALLFLGVAGCKTSTIESRRMERQASYDELSPEQKQLVDDGKIRVGMTEDAVYISWGKPDQVLMSENAEGSATTWLYLGNWLESQHAWRYREVETRNGNRFLERYLDQDYVSRDYVQAEIVFRKGVVAEWRTLARPTDGATPRYY